MKWKQHKNVANNYFNLSTWPNIREGGDIGLLITLVPKILFVSLTTLETKIEFPLVGLLSLVSKLFSQYYNI